MNGLQVSAPHGVPASDRAKSVVARQRTGSDRITNGIRKEIREIPLAGNSIMLACVASILLETMTYSIGMAVHRIPHYCQREQTPELAR